MVAICLTFKFRTVWWQFIDVFFLFMAAFMQLLGLQFAKTIPAAAGKMRNIAMWCAILGIVAFIGEGIAFYVLF